MDPVPQKKIFGCINQTWINGIISQTTNIHYEMGGFNLDKSSKIYSNPVNNILYIENNASSDKIVYRIFDICGVIQMTGKTDPGPLDLGHLNEGIYFIELGNKDPAHHTFIKVDY